MKIETKYNVSDIIFILTDRILELRINYIYIRTYNIDPTNKKFRVEIMYELSNGSKYEIEESQIYDSKEEAGKAWLKKQDLDCGIKG